MLNLFKKIISLLLIGLITSSCVTTGMNITNKNVIESEQAFIDNQKRISKFEGLPLHYTNQFNMKFILIPKGVYKVGSPLMEEGRQKKEKPHYVQLTKSFYIAETETTQKVWNQLIDSNPSKTKGDDYPVEEVIFGDAVGFANSLTEAENIQYRLPTEAEWEVACRAGTNTPFALPELDEIGWYNENSHEKVSKVKGKKPNSIGLYDMHGNVWEWCNDLGGEYPNKELLVDPKGAKRSGGNRVKKGGSYQTGKNICRSAYRNIYQPMVYRHRNTGFRLAFDALEIKNK